LQKPTLTKLFDANIVVPRLQELAVCIQSTRPHQGHVQFEYASDTLIDAWRLQSFLKSKTTSIKDVALASSRLTHSQADAAAFESSLQDGTLKLPEKDTMLKVGSRLFVLELLYQRHQLKRMCTSRHWSPDSSPQGGWNYFVTCEYAFQYPGNSKASDFGKMELPPTDVDFNLMPFIVLGYGCGGVINKALSCHHLLSMLSGGWDLFDKVRREVRTYTSDQGDENDVRYAPLLLDEGSENVDLARARLRAKLPVDDLVGSAFLFPLMIAIVDMLHVQPDNR
jgi:hypothetical protein